MAKKAMSLNDRVKKMDRVDIGLTKISVFLFTLVLITVFPQFLIFVLSVPVWIYLVLFIAAVIRPLARFFK